MLSIDMTTGAFAHSWTRLRSAATAVAPTYPLVKGTGVPAGGLDVTLEGTSLSATCDPPC